MTQLLKNISGQTISLNLGNVVLTIKDGDFIDYDTYVITNANSSQYNIGTIQSYLDNNILTLVSPMASAPTVITTTPSYFIVNFSPCVLTSIVPGTIIAFNNYTNVPFIDTNFIWTIKNKDGSTAASATFVDSTTNTSAQPHVLFSAPGIFSVELSATQISTSLTSSFTATNIISSAVSGTITEKINVLSSSAGSFSALIISQQPTNEIKAPTQSAIFNVLGTRGIGTITYQWYQNGTLIPGATSSAYTVSNITTGYNGYTYYATVSDAVDTLTSTTATLTVTTQYFITANKAAAFDPSAIYQLYTSGYVSVWNGAVEAQIGPNLPATDTGEAIGFNWQDVFIDNAGLLHVIGIGLTTYGVESMTKTLYDYTMPVATPTVWTQAFTQTFYSFYGPDYLESTQFNWWITPSGNRIMIMYLMRTINNSLEEIRVDVNGINASGYATTMSTHQVDSTGEYFFNTAAPSSIGFGHANNWLLTNATNLHSLPISAQTVMYFGGTNLPYIVATDASSKLHIWEGTINLGQPALNGALTDLGAFNYTPIPVLTLPPVILSNSALIYTTNTSGANAVWFNGTTITGTELITTGGTTTFEGNPVTGINGATFQPIGRAKVLSDGSILHSTNSGYTN